MVIGGGEGGGGERERVTRFTEQDCQRQAKVEQTEVDGEFSK